MVSPGYLRDNSIALTDPRVEPLQAQGKTVVFILVDGTLKGALALADIVRRMRRPWRRRMWASPLEPGPTWRLKPPT